MKKAVLIIIAALLLFSCSPQNVWQRTGVISPSPLAFNPSLGSAESENGSVDIIRAFNGERESDMSLSLASPPEWDGKVLYRQKKEAAEAMATMLSAKCYDKEYISSFLRREIDREEIVKSMKNTIGLIKYGEDTLKETIYGFLPVFEEREGEEEYNKVVAAYNAFREQIGSGISSIIDEVFSPLHSLLESSASPTWGEYVKCQLSTNLIGGFLEGMENIVKGVMSKESFQKLTGGRVDFSDREEVEKLFKETTVDVMLSVLNNVVSSVLSPLAVYDKITSYYPEEIGMPSLSAIIVSLGGMTK